MWRIKQILLGFVSILLFALNDAKASHLYGGEIRYEHVKDNLYNIKLVLYVDCGGSASLLESVKKGMPEVGVYRGGKLDKRINLKLDTLNSNIEITPKCLDVKTVCEGGTALGIIKYQYSDTITLDNDSTWLFSFTGDIDRGSSSGRSSAITNITTSAFGNIMVLNATLNNFSAPNSSPHYTSSPTPFFCINVPQEYNIAAIDSNKTDSLVFELVPGLISPSGITPYYVTYRTGYSATSPISATTGSFRFDSKTGQLSFNPNLVQTSLVVMKVSEYRSGKLVGTSMREMNFIVQSTCSNKPPKGEFKDVTLGKMTAFNEINVCSKDSLLEFSVPISDSDGNNIKVESTSTLSGLSLDIFNNNTKSPYVKGKWNLKSLAPGNHVFYLILQDDACPISSKQTIAFTIKKNADPNINITVNRGAGCSSDAQIEYAFEGNLTWNFTRSGVVTKTISGISTKKIKDTLAPGNYTIKLTDGMGCEGTSTFNILPPPLLDITSINIVHPKCNDSSNGAITVNLKAPNRAFRYKVNGSAWQTTNSFTKLKAGKYYIQLIDSNNCTKDTMVELNNPPSFYINELKWNDPNCYNVKDGKIFIKATGGKAPYLFSYDGGTFSTRDSFTNLSGNTYTIKVQDAFGCVRDTFAKLNAPDKISTTSIIYEPSCFDASDGAIKVKGIGGSGALLYALKTGLGYAAVDTFSDLAAGNYVLKVKDSRGCLYDTSIKVNQPERIAALISIKKTSCFGGENGKINIKATGGKPPYTFKLDSGIFSSMDSFVNLKAGNYTIFIKDYNNCIKDTTVYVTSNDAVELKPTIKMPNCYAEHSGVLYLNSKGGVLPYTYSLDGKLLSSTDSVSSLSAGMYILKVKDGEGCTKDSVINISEPEQIKIATTIQNINCYGASTGKIKLNATGGTGLLSFDWNKKGLFSTVDSMANLVAGKILVEIKDVNGCKIDTSFNIESKDSMQIKTAVIKPLCNGEKNGSIKANIVGGTAPYVYKIFTDSSYNSSDSFTGLLAGSYLLSIKDANGCIKDSTVVITNNSPIKIIVSSINPTCNGFENGKLYSNVSGGVAPYTYALGSGTYMVSDSFLNLSDGSYVYKVKDANGCVTDTLLKLNEPVEISVTAQLYAPKCYDGKDGAAKLKILGGTPGYTVRWGSSGTFESIDTFSSLSSTYYSVKIVDANNCTKDTSWVIPENPMIKLSKLVQLPTCKDVENGTIELIPSGGVSPYTTSISGFPITTSTIYKGLKSGKYNIEIRDHNNCLLTDSVVIKDSIQLASSKITTAVLCFNDSNGTVKITPLNGVAPYVYSVNSDLPSPLDFRDKLPAGTFPFKMTDANGCTLDSFFTIKSPEKLVINLTITQPKCKGNSNGAVSVAGKGGVVDYTFAMDSSSYGISNEFDSLSTGTYLFRLKDANGCIKDTLINLNEPEIISLNIDVEHPKCYGDSSGSVTINALGGTPSYSYSIDAGVFDVYSKFSLLPANEYLITVKDTNGCIKDTTLSLMNPPMLEWGNLNILHPTCEGYKDGSIVMNGLGGTPIYQYSIGDLAFQSDTLFNKLDEGIHVLKLKDNNNCLIDTTIALIGYPKIILEDLFTEAPKCYDAANGSLLIKAKGGNGTLIYQLMNTGSTKYNGMFDSLKADYYTIAVVDDKGCKKEFSTTIENPDTMRLSANIIHNDCTGNNDQGSIQVFVQGGNAPYQIKWSNGAEGELNKQLKNEIYTVIVTDSNHCVSQAEYEVVNKSCCEPQFPNAFTPNGDQVNDEFHIVNGQGIKLHSFMIFNRYGACVFSTTDPNKGWDGFYNGTKASSGVYYYHATVLCGPNNDKKIFVKGDVTLIR